MVICAVATCKTKQKTGKGMHAFPSENGKKAAWIKFCKRKDLFNPKTSRICSLHFLPECFERDLRNKLLGLPTKSILKSDAIPTKFDTNSADSISGLNRKHRYKIKQQKDCVNSLLKGG